MNIYKHKHTHNTVPPIHGLTFNFHPPPLSSSKLVVVPACTNEAYSSSFKPSQRTSKADNGSCYQFQSSSSKLGAVPPLAGASESGVLCTDADAEVGVSTDGIKTLPAFTVSSSSSSSSQLFVRGIGARVLVRVCRYVECIDGELALDDGVCEEEESEALGKVPCREVVPLEGVRRDEGNGKREGVDVCIDVGTDVCEEDGSSLLAFGESVMGVSS
ncbi:hypothetical protein C8R48DRAFT_319105 [Suillus tomentosus]|nr:hypothetical protein C8R48DRAFT_319105 [Suillus tomentosus]